MIVENVKNKSKVGPPFPKTIAHIEGWVRYIGANNPLNSLKNVQAHYDIGNELYKLMLDDETLSYTCALWRDPKLLSFRQFPGLGTHLPESKDYMDLSLDQAQLNKIHLIIEKAGITADDEVVELGCGWGGFAIEAALQTGCKITSYNLSVEQLK